MLTLYELNHLVRSVLEQTMTRNYWVEAEISELREVRGHCYMDLVQREELMNTPVARAQARCWASTWAGVGAKFRTVTGQSMRTGMKVLLCVHAQFHEAYGFSWIVSDVDPTFTLGDMARRRMEIVKRLKEEGVFGLQRELQLPLFCQRVAVISSDAAAGYGDFCQQLLHNENGYWFHIELFPAVMQGEQVEQSIIAALNNIYARVEEAAESSGECPFDCVAIIRGGGATSDMSGFDTLALAENVANFPLPIITGIGHERDECVLDMVSHLRVKTPTAAAAFLVERLQQVDHRIADLSLRLTNRSRQCLEVEHLRLMRLGQQLPALFSLVATRQHTHLQLVSQRLTSATDAMLQRSHHRITQAKGRLPLLASALLSTQQHRLQLLAQTCQSLDPKLLLARGYSITLRQGQAVRSVSSLKSGDQVVTRLYDGQFTSVVE